ncbi:hypothetical protein D3C86_1480950 [compost metagenome]
MPVSSSNAVVTDLIIPFLGLTFELKMIYRRGRTNKVSKVAVTKPPITTVASGFCTSAPALVLMAMGRKPREATIAVINTGRKRAMVPAFTRS